MNAFHESIFFSQLLTQLKVVIFNIPQRILVSQVRIAGDFLLFEAPFGQLLARRSHRAVLEVVNQFELAADGLNGSAFFAVGDENLKNVVCVASAVLCNKVSVF